LTPEEGGGGEGSGRRRHEEWTMTHTAARRDTTSERSRVRECGVRAAGRETVEEGRQQRSSLGGPLTCGCPEDTKGGGQGVRADRSNCNGGGWGDAEGGSQGVDSRLGSQAAVLVCGQGPAPSVCTARALASTSASGRPSSVRAGLEAEASAPPKAASAPPRAAFAPPRAASAPPAAALSRAAGRTAAAGSRSAARANRAAAGWSRARAGSGRAGEQQWRRRRGGRRREEGAAARQPWRRSKLWPAAAGSSGKGR
jgi:hypothetical protein